ncbi:thioesterase family protein [Bacillus tianshenii]|nr:thioesterase family protein [Bacillus tianshenii]
MYVSETTIPVRYAETDQMGVVYHANYIIWMEVGRTALIRELGFDYAMMEKDGIISPVLDVRATYKSPVRYGEIATVRTWIEKYDGLRVIYGYEILTESGALAVTGHSEHVCAKKENFRPIRMKSYYPEWHETYERVKKQTE